ncbi:MAG: hypothetical protein IVZ94_08560 [Nitrospirae bacterium]|nr:hypothetical protein [Nitrospirota bacterium]
MIIDAREGDLHDLFVRLREIFASGMKEPVEILLKTTSDVKKVKTFASMSGCQIETRAKNGGYVVKVAECCASCG